MPFEWRQFEIESLCCRDVMVKCRIDWLRPYYSFCLSFFRTIFPILCVVINIVATYLFFLSVSLLFHVMLIALITPTWYYFTTTPLGTGVVATGVPCLLLLRELLEVRGRVICSRFVCKLPNNIVALSFLSHLFSLLRC